MQPVSGRRSQSAGPGWRGLVDSVFEGVSISNDDEIKQQVSSISSNDLRPDRHDDHDQRRSPGRPQVTFADAAGPTHPASGSAIELCEGVEQVLFFLVGEAGAVRARLCK